MPSYLERFEHTPVAQRWPTVRRWVYEEPLPFFAELRKHRPVLKTPEVTLATTFADCTEILRRADIFSVALYKPKQGDYWMAQDDTAVHWREKSIMRAILDREDIPSIRTYVGDKAAAILEAANGEIEAVAGLTRAVPVALVQDWFGFADSNPAGLVRWSYWNQMDAFWNQPFDAIAVRDPHKIVAEREAANEAMRAYLIGLIQRRAGELQAGRGGTDPVSRLLVLSASKALKFDPARVVLNVGGLLIGAVETTSHAAVNALAMLMERPDDLASARAAAAQDDPAAVDGFVFEALRFNPPFPYFFRVCEQDTALSRGTEHEIGIAKGTTVLAVAGSAMFDTEAFPDPDRFDPTRGLGNSFHFGLGLHECLGRVIGEVMIAEIVRQSLRSNGLACGPIDNQGGPVPESWRWRWN
jgi:cytochrome P450